MKNNERSMNWGELAQLSHITQVEAFGFCSCEDNEGKENPYSDCPKEETGQLKISPNERHEILNQFWNFFKESGQSFTDAVINYNDLSLMSDSKLQRIFNSFFN